MYTPKELKEIQDTITGKRELSKQEIDILRAEFGNKGIPGFIYGFTPLFATNQELYDKISKDDKIRRFSTFGFFPESFDLIYNNDIEPQLVLDSGSRGTVGILKHHTKNVVIKRQQSSCEPQIAAIAEELGIGPKQYATLEGFITEEFIEGKLLTKLRGEETSHDRMYDLGRRIGDILKRLHSKEIYYNDTNLSDDFGRSHIFVLESKPAILFDYGVAIRLNDHPDLNDEEVLNYAKTLPFLNGILQDNPSKEQIREILGKERPKIHDLTKEQIMSRDINFINEGLYFVQNNIGSAAAGAIAKGFQEAYFT